MPAHIVRIRRIVGICIRVMRIYTRMRNPFSAMPASSSSIVPITSKNTFCACIVNCSTILTRRGDMFQLVVDQVVVVLVAVLIIQVDVAM